MRHHVVLSSPTDADEIDRRVASGDGPRHVMLDLARRLGAELHHPGALGETRIDRLGPVLIGQPRNWALARDLARRLGPDDIVYCNSEDAGLPLAAACAAAGSTARIVVFIHSIIRPRGRLALHALRSTRDVALFVTNCSTQVAFLRDRAGVPPSRVWLLHEQTDTAFFSPGPASPAKTRPVIASVGLERRDYRSLAAATHDLDVDVRISAFSADAPALARSLPRVMPANMARRFYAWRELQQLYRDADVVVVPIFESVATSGVTSLIEGLASGRPVVVTRSAGLADYQQHHDALVVVPGEDPAALRAAITGLLADPAAASRRAAIGLELARRLYGPDAYVEALARRLEALAAQPPGDVADTRPMSGRNG